jgi:opacity protein-like surface antigen
VPARGLLGERYADVFIGMTKPDSRPYEQAPDTILLFGGDLNWPVSQGLDLHLDLGHERFDETDFEGTATSALVGVNAHFRPGKPVNPFVIARFGIVASSVEEPDYVTSPDSDDTGLGLMVGGGAEFEIGPSAAVRPSLVYQRLSAEGEDVDDAVLGLDGNLWFTKNVFGLAGVAIGLTEGDFTLFGGVGLGF